MAVRDMTDELFNVNPRYRSAPPALSGSAISVSKAMTLQVLA